VNNTLCWSNLVNNTMCWSNLVNNTICWSNLVNNTICWSNLDNNTVWLKYCWKWHETSITLAFIIILQIEKYPNSTVLTINETYPEDSGLITCRLKSAVGTTECSAELYVQGKGRLLGVGLCHWQKGKVMVLQVRLMGDNFWDEVACILRSIFNKQDMTESVYHKISWFVSMFQNNSKCIQN
jgi:hypothetical protein